jgi:UDP-N-acetylglucosamine 2-epimerase (non-hydrolysing)
LKHFVIAGTRPEIIKIAPVIRTLQNYKLDFSFVLTGQHYDHELSKQMISDLDLPLPDLTIKLVTCSPASQIAEIMTKLEPLMKRYAKSVVLVQGDTNSVLSASLTAVKAEVPIGHIEAGLRSYDWRMPEEHNRRMVDHISDILFAPTEHDEKNLLKEGVYGSVFVTGNTVIDAVNEHLPIAEKNSNILENIKKKEFVLATLHRSENVDHEGKLFSIIKALIDSKIQILIPLHPRTKKRLKEFGIFEKVVSAENIQIVPPLGYLDFLVLMKNSKFIITDSGGIQEEGTAPSISKRILIIRNSTERPEAIQCGAAKLVPPSYENVLKEIRMEIDNDIKRQYKCPFGDGDSAKKIVNIVQENEINLLKN